MSVTVERATSKHVEWIVSQLKLFSTFYNTKKNLFGDPEYAAQGVGHIIDEHVCFVAEQDGEPIGFIAGYMAPHPFNPQILLLSECFWWVDEKSRGSRAGVMLLNAFSEFGKKHADWVTMSIIEGTSPINPESLVKRGYHLHERAYLMETEPWRQ